MDSELVFQGRIVSVTQSDVTLPNGKRMRAEIVHHPGGAAAVAFWQRFKAQSESRGGGKAPEFLSTHPVDDKRIAQLQELLPQALGEYQKAKH